jgi:hypothetical protein
MADYAFDPNIVIVWWAQLLLGIGGVAAGFLGAWSCEKYDPAYKDREIAIQHIEESIN